jgi:hypothetical protein
MSRTDPFYSTTAWLAAREAIRLRDGNACVVARLLGGVCSSRLDVHHIKPRAEYPRLALDPANLVTVCSSHHPTWEALRRIVLVLDGEVELPPCHHEHRYRAGREECDRRRREQIALRRALRLARV